MLASEYFSAWYMGRNPTHEVIFSSYAQDRSDDVGKSVRNLMLSENYGKIFPDSVLRNDAKGTRKFQTKEGGSFFSVGWGGAVTGRGANCWKSGTKIKTSEGSVNIEDLHKNNKPPLVLSIDFRGQLCYSSITKSVKIEGAKIYEIQTRAGKILRATSDHRVYSRLRGFVKFRDIKVGEELVCTESQADLPAQTSRPGQTLDNEMYQVQQTICQAECRCPKIHKERVQGCLLFPYLLRCGSCCEKQKKMRNVWPCNTKNENRQQVGCEILPNVSQATGFCYAAAKTAVSAVWQNVPACRLEESVLQQGMFYRELFENIPKEQRKILFDSFPENHSIDHRKRQPRLRGMWSNGRVQQAPGREISNKSNCASYRWPTKEQQSREFGDIVPQMPLSSPSITTDIVSMAPRLCEDTDTVYDIRVAGTHNYFAGGVLSHNCLILDDLIKDRADANSDTSRRKREDWFSSTAYTRLMSDEGSPEGRVLLIMTRWAFNDIASYLLNELSHEKWHILNCPAIAEENDILGRAPGDALWPEKYPIERLNSIKQSVQADDWTSLYQQRPLPKDGGLIKLPWFKEYDPHKMRFMADKLTDGQSIPDELRVFSKIVISIDTAYKPAQINDPSALTVWGYHKNRQYLLEADTRRVEFPQLKTWVQSYHEKYRKWNMGPVPVLIEDAASGQSLIQVLKQQTAIPVIAIRPDKSKVVRMEHISDYVEAGKVYLPERARWLTDFKTQVAQFPYGSHDDLCDSMSQYLKWVYKPKKLKRARKLFFK